MIVADLCDWCCRPAERGQDGQNIGHSPSGCWENYPPVACFVQNVQRDQAQAHDSHMLTFDSNQPSVRKWRRHCRESCLSITGSMAKRNRHPEADPHLRMVRFSDSVGGIASKLLQLLGLPLQRATPREHVTRCSRLLVCKVICTLSIYARPSSLVLQGATASCLPVVRHLISIESQASPRVIVASRSRHRSPL